nr:hypothetical protein [uncultured Dyadobacter sp.]
MTTGFSFSEQICYWLSSLGFQGRTTHGTSLRLPLVEVLNEEAVKIEMLLIGLAAWGALDRTRFLDVLAADVAERRGSGTPVIVIWEDFWISKTGIVKSRIAAMLGVSIKIPARLTQVRRIDNAVTAAFLTDNHLNGPTTSKFRYGLFLPQRYYRVLPDGFLPDQGQEALLVAVATFSHARIFEHEGAPFRSHELIRFASLLNTSVVGALDKLLRAFIRDKQPDDIMTYADIEWSDGRSYAKLGFERRGTMAPRESLLNTDTMLRVREAQKANGESDNPPINYLTVYNLGSMKYVLTTNSSVHAH